MCGLNKVLEYVKDENLRTLLETGNYVYIVLSKYPYYVKIKILESNEELKQWFKELIEEKPKYLCELVENNPFLIYQLAYLYYELFEKIPEELLSYVDPEDLLLGFEKIEEELSKKHLTREDLGSVFNWPYLNKEETEVSEGRLKLLIPIINSRGPSPFFEAKVYFWYNVWKKFGPEYCIKAWKLAIENGLKDYMRLILDCILEDKELTEHFNPFFVLCDLFDVGQFYTNGDNYIETIPLFIGSEEKVTDLLKRLFEKLLDKRANGYNKEIVNDAIKLIEACGKGINEYSTYYEEKIKEIQQGITPSIYGYYKALCKLLPNEWIKFTIYGVVPEYLKVYPLDVFFKERQPLEVVKDQQLKSLLEAKEYSLILFSNYPYFIKEKILKSNNDLKTDFKEKVKYWPEFIVILVGNDPFLIYQLSLLYYNLFNEVPNELLKFLDPENLLFNFIEKEEKLSRKYLIESFTPSFDYKSYKFKTFDDIKLIIPFLNSISDPFYHFKIAIYVYYNIWKNIGKEFLVKLLKNLSKNESLNIIFDYIMKDKQMLEQFNPFFILGYLYKIGYCYNISAVPLFLGTKKDVLNLLIKLRDRIEIQESNNNKEEALYIIKMCINALVKYPDYYRLRREYLGSYESLYNKNLKEILSDEWTNFTIYGIVPKYLKIHPPIIGENSLVDYFEEFRFVAMLGVGCCCKRNKLEKNKIKA